MKRSIYLVPLAVFAILVVYFAVGLTKDPKIIPSALINKPVPAFMLPPLAGGGKPGFSTATFKGRVSVVNIFASWCLPCRAEHPFIERLAASGGAPVYGLNYKDKPKDALKWLADLGDPYTAIGSDLDGRAGIEWGVYGVPETFIIDKTATIRFKHVGPVTADVLDSQLLPLIRELKR